MFLFFSYICFLICLTLLPFWVFIESPKTQIPILYFTNSRPKSWFRSPFFIYLEMKDCIFCRLGVFISRKFLSCSICWFGCLLGVTFTRDFRTLFFSLASPLFIAIGFNKSNDRNKGRGEEGENGSAKIIFVNPTECWNNAAFSKIWILRDVPSITTLCLYGSGWV